MGRPVAARLTLPLKPFVPVTVTVSVMVLPWITVTAAGAALKVKDGGRLTVTATVVVEVTVPEVPVTVTVDVPVGAALVAVKVRTLDAVAGLVAKAAVTPVGSPLTVRVAAPVKPPWSTTLIVVVLVPPSATVTAGGVALRVKPGAALTVSATFVLWVAVPDVPVTVTVTAGPKAAVLEAVSVSTLEPVVVGFGLKAAVTPVGRPETVKVTPAVKPFSAVTLMVSVVLLPCVTVAVAEAGAIV